MPEETAIDARRILIIDDNQAIHDDFRKILQRKKNTTELDRLDAEIFEEKVEKTPDLALGIDSAFQGREGMEMVLKARQDGWPYSMAFVDMRMPPGWNGLETIEHLWQVDPQLEICVCTAFSDFSWGEIFNHLGPTDQLLVLKKPFDNIEVKQIACAQVKKWTLARRVEQQMDYLENKVAQRTRVVLAQNSELEDALNRLVQIQDQLDEAEKLAAHGALVSPVVEQIDKPLTSLRVNLLAMSDHLSDLEKVFGAETELLAACLGRPEEVEKAAGKLRTIRDGVRAETLLHRLSDLVGECLASDEAASKIASYLKNLTPTEAPTAAP